MFSRLTALPRRFTLLTLLLAGLLCGATAVGFHHLIYFFRDLLIINALQSHGALRIIAVIATPAVVSLLIALALRRIAPDAATANLARVRRAYAQDTSLLDLKTLAVTLFVTPISLGAGIPLGPEGPTVVLTSGVALYTARLVGLPKKFARGMIPVGTAAGIAAIFNTPITGVVFALEEVLGTTSRGVLGGTIVAAVAAAVVQRFLLGGEHVLATHPASWTHLWELAAFAVVGIVCGLASAAMIPAIGRLRRILERAIPSIVTRAAMAGAMVGVIGLLAPSTLSVGYEATSFYLHGGGSLLRALTDFGGKAVGFVIALASGLLGGIFAPSLFMGASLGAAIGHAAQLVSPDGLISTEPYAFVGMGALFAGLLRCPISSVLIVVELTGNYDLILPLMLATALSTALSRKIAPLSLTERQLRAEGYREEHAVPHDPLASMTVRDVMTPNPLSAIDSMTFGEVAEAFGNARHRVYPVVNEDRKLIGMLQADDIRTAMREERGSDAIRPFIRVLPLAVRPEEELRSAIQLMSKAGLDRCPVADEDEHLVGFVAPEDILRARIAKLDDSGVREREFELFGGG